MTKLRVHELSKELGIQSKDLIRILNEMGAGVKNHMSTVEEKFAAQVRGSFSTGMNGRKKAPPAPAKEKNAESAVPVTTSSGKKSPPREAKREADKAKMTGTTDNVGKDLPQTALQKQGPQEQRMGQAGGRTTVQAKPERPETQPRERPVRDRQTDAGLRQGQPSKPAARPEQPRAGESKSLNRPPRAGQQVSPGPGGPGRQTRPDLAQGERRPRTAPKSGRPTGQQVSPGPRDARPQGGGRPAAQESGGRRPFGGGQKQARFGEAPAQAKEKRREPAKGRDQNHDRFEKKENIQKFGRQQSKKGGLSKGTLKPIHPATNVKSVQIPPTINVKEFAQAIEVAVGEVIKKLMNLGVMATINQEIDLDTATLVGHEFGVEVTGAPTEEETLQVEEIVDDPESLVPRWPVVTIMGHVDHGKTSLLDAIRESNIIASEAGGITQHIGAYQVDVKGKKITFLDTPGHEAFTAMRARGAQATDIAILVVAADDGVMPQTVEAINHAKAANIPIIVAINKIDKPEANPDRVKQELTQYDLVPEEWGGDTICVEVSALKKIGLDDLLEMILLVAEVKEFKANPNRPAKGTVIETKLDKGRGPVATVLIQNGTLRVGDNIIAGMVSGKVRALMNDKGKQVKKAGPSEPVEVIGLDDIPEAGDSFYVTDEKTARQLAVKRQQFSREQELKKHQRVSLDDLFTRIKEGEVKELNIIIKADVHGSVEAITQSLERLSTEEVRVRVIHGGVGAINESDVMLASASQAIIIGFNVRPDPIAKRIAERENVDIRLYRVIYNIIDDVKKAMEGMLSPEYEEVLLGRAEVRAVFRVPKVGAVAGSFVLEGKITRNAEARVLRDNVVIYEGKIESLRRFKDDVKEVSSGFECGIGLERFNDIKEGDIIETFTNQEVKKTGATGSGG